MAEESDNDKAAAMIANALIRSEGSRHNAATEAFLRGENHPKADHRVFWDKVHKLLKSGSPISPYFGSFDSIPNPNAVHYVRVNAFATGGAVSHSKATKEQSNYSPFGDEERHCSICSMWREPNRCTEVAGDISRTAVCDYFEPKK